VHFIHRHGNPTSAVFEENNFMEPLVVSSDNHSHLYGLVILPHNSFEIQIDGTRKASSNLLTSMEPPIAPR
jgi:hypothetical protein